MGGRGGEGGSRAKPGNQLVYIYIQASPVLPCCPNFMDTQ